MTFLSFENYCLIKLQGCAEDWKLLYSSMSGFEEKMAGMKNKLIESPFHSLGDEDLRAEICKTEVS